MTVEDYHGRCLACGHAPTLARWGSVGWAWWQACPACGFTLTSGDGWPYEGPEAAWAIFGAHGVRERAVARGLDPRLLWYALSLVHPPYSPDAPGPVLVEPEGGREALEAAVERHRGRGWRRYTPLDVDERALEAIREYDPETAEELLRILPHLREG